MKKPCAKKPLPAQFPAGVYRHHKGNFYLVLGVAKHSETEEVCVVYTRLYARDSFPLWVRPLEMFTNRVTLKNGNKVKRFTYVGLSEPKA